jgi:mannan endo-1,4-beta-mannosidase
MKQLIMVLLVSLFCPGAFAQVDPHASIQAKKLFARLYSYSRNFDGKIIYGQQSPFLEGRGWQADAQHSPPGSLPESDLYKVIQKNPGLSGFDLSVIGSWNETLIINQMREIHKRGGVVTLSWHMPNFNSDGIETDAWHTDGDTVRKIMEDQKYKEAFFKKLDRLVVFLQNLKDVPVIYRPWHEHNFNWFWWGAAECPTPYYIALWKMTELYLQKHGIHNLLYAYSPNTIRADYMSRYPGDEWVDILGVDQYFNGALQTGWQLGFSPLDHWKTGVIRLLKTAEAHNKIPAITEFGNESLTLQDFWTDYFSWPIEKAGILQVSNRFGVAPPSVKPAYVMLWRNDASSPSHFFGPFPGQALNQNFKALVQKNLFDFLEDMGPVEGSPPKRTAK